MTKTIEFERGQTAFLDGYSLHYNPFMKVGSAEQFGDWIAGWQYEQAKQIVRQTEAEDR